MPIVDPVCCREIDDVEYPEEIDHEGKTYWFCSLEHAQEFQKHPEKYVYRDIEDKVTEKVGNVKMQDYDSEGCDPGEYPE